MKGKRIKDNIVSYIQAIFIRMRTLLIVFLFCFILNTNGQVNTFSVSASADDAHENFTTLVFDRTNTLAITMENCGGCSMLGAGYRFNNINLIQGSTVNSVTLKVYTQRCAADDTNFDIYGNNVDNANDFLTEADIDTRARTTATVAWPSADISAGCSGGLCQCWQTAPGITSIVQEIINRPGWVPGNSIVILFVPKTAALQTLETRSYDYDNSSNYSAELIIDGTFLPVELVSFNAKYENENIHLYWSTASEQNNDYFEIQRTVPSGEDWKVVGNVKGAGNSSTVQNYEFIDAELPSPAGEGQGVRYYRLKQVDFDGKFEIFSPVSVNFDPNNVEWFFVNPNIISSSDKINLELTNLPSGNDVYIHLFDLLGNIVYSNSLSLPPNGKGIMTTLALPETFSSGMYALRVTCGNKIGMKKILVQ